MFRIGIVWTIKNLVSPNVPQYLNYHHKYNRIGQCRKKNVLSIIALENKK